MTLILRQEVNLGLCLALFPDPETLLFSGVGSGCNQFLPDNMLSDHALVNGVQVVMMEKLFLETHKIV